MNVIVKVVKFNVEKEMLIELKVPEQEKYGEG